MSEQVRIDSARHHAVLFDLDGVITDTASLHQAAWRELFDAFLADRGERAGEDHGPFTEADYRQYVDGKPRLDGVRDFLASRGVEMAEGSPDDEPGATTVHGLGARKDQAFHARLERDGVDVYDSTVELIRTLRERGLGVAVFSSSRNCRTVLERAGLLDLFDARVDGDVAAELGLPGKPDPAVPLEAASRLGVAPESAVLVEDAQAGVEAGRAGGFGLVIGIDRGAAGDLEAHGADVVVADLAEVTVVGPPSASSSDRLA